METKQSRNKNEELAFSLGYLVLTEDPFPVAGFSSTVLLVLMFGASDVGTTGSTVITEVSSPDAGAFSILVGISVSASEHFPSVVSVSEIILLNHVANFTSIRNILQRGMLGLSMRAYRHRSSLLVEFTSLNNLAVFFVGNQSEK